MFLILKKIFNYLQANLILIIPVLIIGFIAYVHLAPDKVVKPCLSTKYIVAEVTSSARVYSGKVTLKYRSTIVRSQTRV